MLARIRKAEQNDKGFTLIELLVVVIIIGILSAIAIPTFLKQREKAWDKAVASDLVNNALKMEEAADDDPDGLFPTAAPPAPYAFKQSETNLATEVLSANKDGFCLSVTSDKDYKNNVKMYDSRVGRPQATTTGDAETAVPGTDCTASFGATTVAAV